MGNIIPFPGAAARVAPTAAPSAAAPRRDRIVIEHAQAASAKFELAASLLDGALGDLALSGVRLNADDVTRLRDTITWLETRALRVDETVAPTTLEDIA